MLFSHSLPLLTLSFLPLAIAQTCAPVHIIIARASNEPQGPGVINSLAALIEKDHPGTTQDAVVYPATLTSYANSSSEGTAVMTSMLKEYVASCKDSKVVMLGYSQGAHVVGDVMCGGGGARYLNNATQPVDKSVGDHVVAMIQMGDPRHLGNQSYNVGSGNVNGLFPRQPYQLCDYYASKIQSYCDDGDPFCDDGDDRAVHRNYTFKYNNVALDFVNSKLGLATANATSTASSNGTSTSSSGAGSSSGGSTAPINNSAAVERAGGLLMILGLSIALL